MYPFYLGIDLHLKRSYLVLMDAEGEVIDKRRLKNTEMETYISRNVPKETYAVMEATRNWPFFYNLLAKHVDRVELAHAKGVRMIAAAAVKTDQIDASGLAHLARLNFLPIAYAAPKEIRDLRQHLRYREWLIDERRRAKNRIHAVLAGYNLASPVTDLFGRAGREWLQEVAEKELRPVSRRVVLETLTMIDQLDDQIKELAKDIPLPEDLKPKAEILMSMPGIGKLLSAVILAEIGDIKGERMNLALEHLADLLSEMNAIGEKISEITQRPATIGHTGEYIAAEIFDIELEEKASAKGVDGHFKSGSLAGKSVNIKWYSKLEYMLDITPQALPDYYLVMTGPKGQAVSSKGGTRPWLINYVFLFNAAELVIELNARGVKIGVASSVRKHEWQAAEIYPNKRSMVYRLADEQMAKILAFGSDWSENWF